MDNLKDCITCASCEEILGDLNARLIKIGDTGLYNIRYELGRHVDYELYKLLLFYKTVLTDICNDDNCDCYYTDPIEPVVEENPCAEKCNCASDPCPNAALSPINHCICGCCPPENPVCNEGPFKNKKFSMYNTKKVTKENILERIKILLA